MQQLNPSILTAELSITNNILLTPLIAVLSIADNININNNTHIQNI